MLSSIPKPYTLNKKDAKTGKQLSFTQNTQEKFLFCLFVCVSLLPFSLSLSLSLSVEFFGSLEADTSFEEEELRFFQTRSLERIRNNKL